MKRSDGARLVLEYPCEHDMTGRHAISASVWAAIERAAGEPISPDEIEVCPGGTRVVLSDSEAARWVAETLPFLETL